MDDKKLVPPKVVLAVSQKPVVPQKAPVAQQNVPTGAPKLTATKPVAPKLAEPAQKNIARKDANEPVVRIYMRYDKARHVFEFKPGEDAQTIEFPESALPQVRAKMLADPKDGQGRAEGFDFLVNEARKDPEGRFVSVTNAPVVEGQAVLRGK
jgi:hypothetical protein